MSKNLKIYEWDVVKHAEGKDQTTITTDSVAFIGNGVRYVISVDKDTGCISIYKASSSGLDTIQITPYNNNKIIIE